MTRTFDTWYNSEVRRLLERESEQILADAEFSRDLESGWERERAEQILADAEFAREFERGHSPPSPSKRRRTDSQPESSAAASARGTPPQPPHQSQQHQPHQQPQQSQQHQPWMTAVTNILSQPMSSERIPGTNTTNEVHVLSWEFEE